MKKFCLMLVFLFIAFISFPMPKNALEQGEILTNDLELIPIENGKRYEVTLPNDNYTTILLHTYEDVIWSNGFGEVTLNNGEEHTVTLMDADGTIHIFTIHPNLGKAKLKSVTIPGLTSSFIFLPNVYEYHIDVTNATSTFNPTIVADNGATYTLSSTNLNVGANTINVNVTAPGFESTTYTFHVNRTFVASATKVTQNFSFNSSKKYYEFTAPADNYYTIEVWGARSGGNHQNSELGTAGKGGYSTGTIKLKETDKLYIYVGGQGSYRTSTKGTVDGGYNGGGYAQKTTADHWTVASGGGATDVRFFGHNVEPSANDLLWDSDLGLKSRIIVAGGGGGSGMCGEAGGFGGGTTGGRCLQNSSYMCDAATQSSGHAFGKGADAIGANGTDMNWGSSSGGGGWYGGKVGGWGAAGGGTGYVWTSSTKNLVPAGYNVSESYFLTEATTISATSDMPNYNGGTMKGNNASGYARITYYKKNELDTLTSISIDKDGLYPEFNEDTKTYYVDLGIDDTEITISATTANGTGLITGTGKKTVVAGENIFPITFQNLDGRITTYQIIANRASDNSTDLAGFKVNGVLYTPFEPSDRNFTVLVDTEATKINLELLKKYPGQGVPENNIYDFTENSITKSLVVFSEKNAGNSPYTFTFNRQRSSRLKSLTIEGGELQEKFDPKVTNYTLNMDKNARELTIDAKSWFPEAFITTSEIRYIPLDVDKVTITVQLDSETTVYTLNINRVVKPPEDVPYMFPYTGNVQTFVAEYTNEYVLEVWGARGGGKHLNSELGYAGLGGYSTGTITLNEGDILYIYVGGEGSYRTSTKGTVAGGWNGGGYAQKTTADHWTVASGGGATDIRFINGAWDDVTSLNSRVIVAGGGGGAGMCGEVGGAGGGTTGGSCLQNSSTMCTAATQTSGHAFGKGADAIGANGTNMSWGSSAGGGGWYGGKVGGWGSAGGGTGFVWTKENKNIVPASYSVLPKYYLTNASTIAGNQKMPTYDGENLMTGNNSSGYAKITAKATVVGDAFLETLTVNDGAKALTNGEDPTPFEVWNMEYTIFLSQDESTAKFTATSKDSNAIIKGVGNYEFGPGTTDHEITVTTNNTTKTYTIHVVKEASTDIYPTNIILRNPQSYLCPNDGTICAYTFAEATPNYTIYMPYQTEKVTLEPVLKSKYQTVKYYKMVNGVKTPVSNGLIELVKGDNEFIIEIYSESSTNESPNYSTYTYNILKDDSTNNFLENLQIKDLILQSGEEEPVPAPSVSIAFNKETYEYYFNIPAEYDGFTLEAEAESSVATVKVNGSTELKAENLQTGNNTIYVTVSALNGTARTYILYAYKEPKDKTFLSSLVVRDEDNVSIPLTPKFSKTRMDYTINVDSDVNNIIIEVQEEEGTLSGDVGAHTLVSGKNTFTVTVTSGTGKAQNYKIDIIKAKSSNCDVTNISFGDDIPLDPAFSNSIKKYSITVAREVTELNPTVTLADKRATYTIKGNTNLNENVNTIIITSIAEDKSTQSFEITVNKIISKNNDLKTLEITSGDALNETYENPNTTYTFNVDSDVSSITINGIADDERAVVVGNGTYSLQKGENTITLTVISESKEEKTYTIKVNRAKSTDASLLEISTNQQKVPTLGGEEYEYDYFFNVQYEVNTIDIIAIPNAKEAKVSGDGTKSLNTGINDFIVVVTPEEGPAINYRVRIKRDMSDNDDLSYLYVEEGGLKPSFNETIVYYDVTVPNEIDNVNKLHVEAIHEDKEALVEIFVKNGNTLEVLDSSLNIPIKDTKDSEDEDITKEIIVRVYSEKNKATKTIYKEYSIRVTRQVALTSDISLDSLETNRGAISPSLTPNFYNYTLEVENAIKDITVTATADPAKNLTIQGNGTYDLKVGKNLITIFVIDENGLEVSYQLVVTRKKSNDATLSNVVIKGHTFTPKFNKDTDSYSFTTSASNIEFTTIIPTESEATYTVTGDKNLVVGTNTLTITVTAPDGTTKKPYTFTITKEGSKNANLKSLEVEGYTLKPSFHKGVTFYAVEVGNDVNSVIISAEAEDENALSVTGTGLKPINAGENYFDIVVTSQANTSKIYKVLVIKEKSHNNYLASLNSNEGKLLQKDTEEEGFVKTKNNYKITVPNDIDKITFTGALEDSTATVVGLTEHNLTVGLNIINITVTSAAGDTNVYVVEVTREEIESAYLVSLEVEDYSLDTTFNKEIFEYYVDVNTEVDAFNKLNLSYEKEDPNATIEITDGNEYSCTDGICNDFAFDIGMNEVHIIVTRNELQEEYILYVNRAMSTNNFLSKLLVEEASISPAFDPDTMLYTVEVERNVDKITVEATKEDTSATILDNDLETNGQKEFNLELGENLIEIKVKSSIGITRTYKIKANRKKDDDKRVLSIRVSNKNIDLDLTPGFSEDEHEYTMTVDSDINFVQITAVLNSENATVTGTGTKEIKAGIENEFVITATAEDGGTNSYTIKITKAVSTNNNLSKLIPSVGTLDPTFKTEKQEYKLELENDQDELYFTVEAESNLTLVSGHETLGVPEGESTRIISATAEDNSIKNYTVTVNRKSESEARLSSLTLDGYEFEFDSETFTYNIRVSKSKRTLTEEEITAIALDEEATVNKMGDINLVDGIINVYTIEVIAKDGVTTQPYTLNITRDSEEFTLTSDVYDIVRNDTEDYVIGILPSTNDDTFKNNFTNEITMLHVYKEETELENGKLVATEMVIKLESEDYVYDVLKIIVRGDLTKDGKVDITDQVKLINYVGKAITFNRSEMLAGDLTFDGRVDITDQVKLINYVGKAITSINPIKVTSD